MRVNVTFYSYFKDLAGCDQTVVTLPTGSTVADLLQSLHARFPGLVPLEKSTRIAVGVEYQDRDYVLREGDAVALFPPVQGG